jgi:ubiquinol-cytochrome c reductase iron-sulfur subunit
LPERRIAIALVATIVASLALTVVYASGGQPQAEGSLLAVALGGMGFAFVTWAHHLMPNEPRSQDRDHVVAAVDADAKATFAEGALPFTRRRLLTRLLGGAAAAFGVALVFPIRSLGPNPGDALDRTSWTPGARLVDSDGEPVLASDVAVGGVVTVFPQGHVGDASAQTLLIRAAATPVTTRPGREDWSPEGYLAFSKVCTHAGCPVGLYQHRTNQLLCPCHQSLFDVAEGARPVFGPAPRSLPQLPLTLDDNGFLVAQRDFTEPIGPAFWNRS